MACDIIIKVDTNQKTRETIGLLIIPAMANNRFFALDPYLPHDSYRKCPVKIKIQ
jgi:hypothetical protein